MLKNRMVGTWKSQNTDIVDLNSTVTIVCFRHVNRNRMNVPLSFFCSISQLYCLPTTDDYRDQSNKGFLHLFFLESSMKCSPAV